MNENQDNQHNYQQPVNQSYVNNNQNINQDVDIKYATASDRLLACIGDALRMLVISIIIWLLIGVLSIVAGALGIGILSALLFATGPILLFLLIIGGQPLYCFVSECSNKHNSKGKIKRNMFVVNNRMQNLSFGESFLRMIFKILTLVIPFAAIISLIAMCVTEKHQALHDLILSQVVVKK